MCLYVGSTTDTIPTTPLPTITLPTASSGKYKLCSSHVYTVLLHFVSSYNIFINRVCYSDPLKCCKSKGVPTKCLVICTPVKAKIALRQDSFECDSHMPVINMCKYGQTQGSLINSLISSLYHF